MNKKFLRLQTAQTKRTMQQLTYNCCTQRGHMGQAWLALWVSLNGSGIHELHNHKIKICIKCDIHVQQTCFASHKTTICHRIIFHVNYLTILLVFTECTYIMNILKYVQHLYVHTYWSQLLFLRWPKKFSLLISKTITDPSEWVCMCVYIYVFI